MQSLSQIREHEYKDLFDLSGEVAVVTGGAGGIGSCIALAFAKFGTDVVIVDKVLDGTEELAEKISDIGRRVLVKKVDVTDPEEVEILVDSVMNEFGKVDILFHTVGGTFRKPALETTLEEWNKVIETNLTSTFLCNRAIGKVMVQQRKGKIINVSSCASFFPYPGRCAYAASKAGVNQLTKALALEWAEYNVNVNAIVPGLTKHAKNADFFSNTEVRKKMISKIPLGRLGEPWDLVGASIFLASKASNWVTGQILAVEGGRIISDFSSELQ